MTPILGIWASQNYPRVTTSFESIATVSVGSGGAADITFSSIPGTYTHLQIRGIARSNESGNSADSLRMIFNSDTNANYSRHRLYGYDSVVYAGAGANTTYIQCLDYPYSGATANAFGAGIIDILDYANTNKYKTIRSLAGDEMNAAVSSALSFYSGSWRNTSAISTIKITTGSGSFAQYSHFALYGIKGA